MTEGNIDMITILGATACGKTKLATQLAFLRDGEIISADSRQVYRGMDIGTGKDYTDYIVNGNCGDFYASKSGSNWKYGYL